MIKALDKAGTHHHNGGRKGKYTFEFGEISIVKWVDLTTYRCDDCRVVYDFVDGCVMVRSCSKHIDVDSENVIK